MGLRKSFKKKIFFFFFFFSNNTYTYLLPRLRLEFFVGSIVFGPVMINYALWAYH